MGDSLGWAIPFTDSGTPDPEVKPLIRRPIRSFRVSRRAGESGPCGEGTCGEGRLSWRGPFARPRIMIVPWIERRGMVLFWLRAFGWDFNLEGGKDHC